MRPVFAALSLFLSYGALAEPCLEVEARVGKEVSAYPAIEFAVINSCTFDVSIYPARLPWGSWWSINVDAVEEVPPQLALRRYGFNYHDSRDAVTIVKGSRLSGTVSMNGWFADFAKVNRRSAITVHWTYSFPEQLKMGWVSGSVVFPRSSVESGLR